MKSTIIKTIKSILVTLLSFFALDILQAQETPTFEQTVNYIISNTKGRVMYPGDLDAYSRVKGYHLKDVKIDKTGRVELLTDQKFDDNQFSIIFNIFDLVDKVDYQDGIRAHKYLVHFNGLNVSKGYGIAFATDADAQKIARAFRHLRKVTEKPNDLFSQVPEEEKKTKLSREETLDYINKMIYYNGDYIASVTHFVDKEGHEEIWNFANGRIYYSASNKKYNFETRHKSEFYDRGRDPFQVIGPLIFNNDNINFKYYHHIEIKYQNGFKGIKIAKLVVVFVGEGNFTPEFSIYLPWNFSSKYGDRGVENFEPTYKKEIQRLKKAFERLKELDSDEKDPFD